MAKSTNAKNKDLKLVSTEPVCDEKQYGVYANILHQQIQAKNVFNIGIIAPYGAGKSSLIKTYKDTKLNWFQRRKVTTISLANFNSDNDKPINTDKSNATDTLVENKDRVSNESKVLTKKETAQVKDIESDIEKSILEQIIFKESKAKLPNSRLKRIDNRHGLMALLFALLITTTIALICCSVLEYCKKLPCSNGENFYYYFGAVIGSVVLLLFMLLYSNRLNKISFKDIETDISENNNYSVLNTFIDEILYYFSATRTNIVIIEDLDRFDNTDVFSKLRELNFLINNSKIVRQKVTFIYAVKDTLFKTENDRAKFFDYILSLVPILSFTNARKILNDEMEKCCSKDMLLPQTYIYEVSHFIEEMRILKNVINDYVTYYNTLNITQVTNEDKNVKLFSLALYKNLRPADFAELQFGRGELADLFESKKKKIDEKIKILKNEIVDLEKELTLANEMKIKSFSIFKSFIKGMIIDHNQNYIYNIDYADIANLQSFKNIGRGLSLNLYRSNTYYCTVEYLEKQLGDTLINFEDRISRKTTLDISITNNKLTEKRNLIKSLLNYTLQEFIKEDEFHIKDELLRYFLTNGYIAEDYKEFVAHSDQDLLSENDKVFVRAVLSKHITEYVYRLDNPFNVIREISPERFSDKFVMNFNLVEYLLSYKDGNKYLLNKKDNLIKYLSARESIVQSFIKAYVNNDYNIDIITIELVKHKQYFLYDLLVDKEITDFKKASIIRSLITHFDIGDIKNQNVENILCEFLNNYERLIDEVAVAHMGLFEDLAVELNLKVKHLCCNVDNHEIAQFLVDNNLYELNCDNLEFIICNLKEVHNEEYINAPLNIIYETEDKRLIEYLSSNIEQTLCEIIKTGNQTAEKQSVLEKILNNEQASLLTRKLFINKQSIKYECSNIQNHELLQYLFEVDKVSVDWNNVIKSHNVVKWESIVNFVCKHSVEFGKIPLSDKNVALGLCNSVQYADLKTFEELSRAFQVDIATTEIKDDDILAVLIKNAIIQSTETTFLTLNQKPKAIIAMLRNNPSLVDAVADVQFDDSTIETVVLDDELSDSIKSRMIVKTTYVPISQDAIEKTMKILTNKPITNCRQNLVLRIVENEHIASMDKIKFLENNDGCLSNQERMEFMIKVEPSLSELQNNGEQKFEDNGLSNIIASFLEDKGICKRRQLKTGFKLTKKV